MAEAIGRPLVRACHRGMHRGIREFCLSAARVYLCDKRAVDHDQVLIRPSRSSGERSRARARPPPRPSFPEGSILPSPLGQIGVPFRRPWTGGESSTKRCGTALNLFKSESEGAPVGGG
jgi:hypothetical protein